MPSKIRVLDEQTINMIAAGEVIENPASVVKELVENAIDAGSTEITVDIVGGGRQLIRVTDNGSGMNSDDALLCLERHATSKLQEICDIHSLLTMGFRGEAVPSIASISKFTLHTAVQGEAVGTLIMVEGGKIKSKVNAVRAPGTTVEVGSLFFNVPVRKKFQRSPTHDANEILKVVTKLSLAYPSIRFQLTGNEKSLLTTPQVPDGEFIMQLKERMHYTLGEEFCQSLFPVTEEKDGMKLEGFIGYPSETRQNRSEQYLFINRRAVVSHSISYGIKEGYGSAIAANRHPVYVLHLTLPTENVDVNVHPQKREVRLFQEFALKEMVVAAVQRAFHRQDPPPVFHYEPVSLPEMRLAEEPAYFLPAAFPEIRFDEEQLPRAQREFSFELPKQEVVPKVLGSLSRFILIKTEEGELALVDAKAARARVIYEQLLKDKGKCPTQILLFPHTLDVNPLEATVISENLGALNEMGFEIREIGKRAFMVNAIPVSLDERHLQELIVDMAHQMREFQDPFEMERKKKLAQIAARHASPTTSSDGEAFLLVRELVRCPNSSHCPLGRPTMAALTPEDLTTLFSKKSCIKKE